MSDLQTDELDLSGGDTVRTVCALDGRHISIQSGIVNKLKTREGKHVGIDLQWVQTKTILGDSAFTLIVGMLSTHSLAYCSSISRSLGIVLQKVVGDKRNSISITDVEQFVLPESNIPSAYLNFLLPALRRWQGLGLSGLSQDLISWLDDGYSWEERGRGTYFALITNDPERGALTTQELHNLHAALNKAYSTNAISQKDYTLVWMFIGTGMRPIQLARMVRGDVRPHNGPEGEEVTLFVPLAKGAMTSKIEKWQRKAPSVLAECLRTYLRLPEVKAIGDTDQLISGSPQYYSGRVATICSKLDTWSDRLSGPIPITPYRFRYTLATRALAQGASDHEVARLLTHRSTTAIQYYRASMPTLQRPIRSELGREMEYFAKAFQGRLIEDLAHATRANDADALIFDFLHLCGKAIGACGTRAECYQYAPIACLPCDHFEPFVEAPWEELFASLLEDREREDEPRIRELNINAISALVEIIARRDLLTGKSRAAE